MFLPKVKVAVAPNTKKNNSCNQSKIGGRWVEDENQQEQGWGGCTYCVLALDGAVLCLCLSYGVQPKFLVDCKLQYWNGRLTPVSVFCPSLPRPCR